MKFRNIIWCTLALLALASCKEENDEVEEFANWQNVNDTYFSNLVSETQSKIDEGQTTWVLMPCYSYPDNGMVSFISSFYLSSFLYSSTCYIFSQNISLSPASCSSDLQRTDICCYNGRSLYNQMRSFQETDNAPLPYRLQYS